MDKEKQGKVLRALKSAQILLNGLRFRSDWPSEEAVNNAIDEWLNRWIELEETLKDVHV